MSQFDENLIKNQKDVGFGLSLAFSTSDGPTSTRRPDAGHST